jgi:hypothetical protein
VTYGRVAEAKTSISPGKALQELKKELRHALEEIYAFSLRCECSAFAKYFANALESLSVAAPLHGYHKDLSVDGTLSTDAVVLLDACQTSWVFAGMGSWNDMFFEGDLGREYDRVSEKLFRLLTEIIPVAANDSFKLI